MNRFDFLSAMGELPENLVADASYSRKSSKKAVFGILGTVAACFLIVILVNIWSLVFGGAGAAGPSGDSDGAMMPQVTASVYYLSDGEIASTEIRVADENELLYHWREYNGIPQDIPIYLASPLNLSPDGSFSVNVSVGGKIENYFKDTDGSSLLESLRLTVLSYMEEATSYNEIHVTVAVQ